VGVVCVGVGLLNLSQTYLHANDVFLGVIVHSADGSVVDLFLQLLNPHSSCAGHHYNAVCVCVCVCVHVLCVCVYILYTG